MQSDNDFFGLKKNKIININELKSFILTKFKEQAAVNGREQTPKIQGRADKILGRC